MTHYSLVISTLFIVRIVWWKEPRMGRHGKKIRKWKLVQRQLEFERITLDIKINNTTYDNTGSSGSNY